MEEYFKGSWLNQKKKTGNIERFADLLGDFTLYDLGSAGGTPPPFCWIKEKIKIINFEPDPRSESDNQGDTVPIAIGPENLDKLYLNRRETTSSLLQPNRKVINRYDFTPIFGNVKDIFETVNVQKVKTIGLDDIISNESWAQPDFLKIDVQGLSLEVLESAGECLTNSTLGIHIEVEFLETYKGQKTFGHVHEFLYDLGFEIFRITNLNHWYYKTPMRLQKITGQDAFCDLLYFRNIDSIDRNSVFWNSENSQKTILLFLLHNLNDAAAAFFERFNKNDLIPDHKFNNLKTLIEDWETAQSYFFFNKSDIIEKILDYSPRKLLRFLKKTLRKKDDI